MGNYVLVLLGILFASYLMAWNLVPKPVWPIYMDSKLLLAALDNPRIMEKVINHV